MPPATRLSDSTDHGLITAGSGNTFVNSLPSVRLGDLHACSHGAAGVLKGSATVFINGLPATRMADVAGCSVKGPSPILFGSPNTNLGG
ncbi:MAG: PAAR domain-containing protein [Polyangiaceae bacterium]